MFSVCGEQYEAVGLGRMARGWGSDWWRTGLVSLASGLVSLAASVLLFTLSTVQLFILSIFILS